MGIGSDTPLTDKLVLELAHAGSDAAAVHHKPFDAAMAGASARFDAFKKVTSHAQDLERDLARLTEENEALRKVIADVEDHTLTMANGYKSVEVKFVLNEIAGMLRAAIKEGS